MKAQSSQVYSEHTPCSGHIYGFLNSLCYMGIFQVPNISKKLSPQLLLPDFRCSTTIFASGSCRLFVCLTVFLTNAYYFAALSEFQIRWDKVKHLSSVLQATPRLVTTDKQNLCKWHLLCSSGIRDQSPILGVWVADFKAITELGKGVG